MREIDVVIPVAPKDLFKLHRCIEGITRFSRNPIRAVHVISPVPVELAQWELPVKVTRWGEEGFPFSKEDVTRFLMERGCAHPNGSWYYQQLLKLYVFRVIPGLLQDVLILDSDFVFTQEVEFVDEDGRTLLALGYPLLWERQPRGEAGRNEHVHATFARRLVSGWSLFHAFSGMHHHLLARRTILDALMARVEEQHGKPFWRAFLEGVDTHKWNAASEYVLYHHFALGFFPTQVRTRHLDSRDIIYEASEGERMRRVFQGPLQHSGCQAVGYHGFLDLRTRLRTMDYLSEELRQWMLAEESLCFALTLRQGVLGIEPTPAADAESVGQQPFGG
jgi:hypothetical protein